MKKAPTKGRRLHQSGVHRPILEPLFGRFGELGACVEIVYWLAQKIYYKSARHDDDLERI